MQNERQEKKAIHNEDWLTDLIIGMSDGLIVPFALAAGLSGLELAANTILFAGIGITVAGSFLLGLGGYLTGRSGNAKELPQQLGLSEEVQRLMAEDNAKDQENWDELMKQYQLNLDKPDPKRAASSALTIGLSYIVGGLVPLSPYFFIDTPIEALKISALATLICLFIFGYFKSRITGVNPWAGALRMTLTGAVAAGTAFGAAWLIAA